VEEWNYPPFRRVQPFFYSVPELNNDEVLLEYQQAFIRKVLEVSLKYSNGYIALIMRRVHLQSGLGTGLASLKRKQTEIFY